jgi:uncharacterized protein (DUF433 family)
MDTAISSDGRISGSRITVYELIPYLEDGWEPEAIVELLRLTPQQFQAAVQYIEANRSAVMMVHRQIDERNARGNSPELQAKFAASRAKVEAWWAEHRTSSRSTLGALLRY